VPGGERSLGDFLSDGRMLRSLPRPHSPWPTLQSLLPPRPLGLWGSLCVSYVCCASGWGQGSEAVNPKAYPSPTFLLAHSPLSAFRCLCCALGGGQGSEAVNPKAYPLALSSLNYSLCALARGWWARFGFGLGLGLDRALRL